MVEALELDADIKVLSGCDGWLNARSRLGPGLLLLFQEAMCK